MRKIIISIVALSLMLFSVSCTSEKPSEEVYNEDTQKPVTEVEVDPNTEEVDPNTDAIDPAAGIVLAGADEAKQIDISTITSIELFNLDDTLVEKIFTEDDIASLGQAYNDSMIDDVSYIEMLAGYRMVITLGTEQTIQITSYGNENNVVATTNGNTYHLICPEIGKLLLSAMPE